MKSHVSNKTIGGAIFTSSCCLLYNFNVAPIIALARHARKYGTFGGATIVCSTYGAQGGEIDQKTMKRV